MLVIRRLFSAAVIATTLLVMEAHAANELPPVGETILNGHASEYLGTIDGCRLWMVKYWGKEVFIARCPEGAANVETETGGKHPVRVPTVPLN